MSHKNKEWKYDEVKEEKKTLWDFLKQEITIKIYQLMLIFSLGLIVGSLFK